MPTHEELADKIDSLSNAAIPALPITHFYCWYAPMTAQDVMFRLEMNDRNKTMKDDEKLAKGQELVENLRQAIFQVAKPSPLDPSLTVFAIFQWDSEVRVYSTGKAFTRHRLNRNSPTFGVELMHEETFCQEIAEEWDAMAGIEPDDDEPEVPEAKPKTVLQAVSSTPG